ncbi:CobW C-terminal domain-containing protein [Haematococcus lacustris]|uniref:CobW C-terminal domain-containing protein n=1 Tax=Haematococcus lacustris TaxID=44745 RepID=A0A699YW89_HAELA|nr:CobW C-terminal domain-containing protein [Haematococcus lacustris]
MSQLVNMRRSTQLLDLPEELLSAVLRQLRDGDSRLQVFMTSKRLATALLQHTPSIQLTHPLAVDLAPHPTVASSSSGQEGSEGSAAVGQALMQRLGCCVKKVITGFLGSGKTFGEIDIDSELVVKQEVVEGSRDTVMQLSNGCLCCTVRDDLIQALNRLVGGAAAAGTGYQEQQAERAV